MTARMLPLVLTMTAGCFAVEHPGQYRCSPEHPECPAGQHCQDGLCVSEQVKADAQPKVDTQGDDDVQVNKDWIVSTVAGVGTPGFKDGDALTEAFFNAPTGVAVGMLDGRVYVADSANARIRSFLGSQVITAAGTGAAGFTDGPKLNAQFDQPYKLAMFGDAILVVDRGNQRIRKIAGDSVTTLAGSSQGYQDGPGASAMFNSPTDVAAHNAVVFVSDSDNHVIRKVESGNVGTLAGTPGQPGYADGPEMQAKFETPYGIDVDGAGRVFVADRGNSVIRIIENGVVSTVAGVPNKAGYVDGPLAQAQFAEPNGLAVTPAGDKIFVADRVNHAIRLIDRTSGVVTTIAGGSGQGFADGPGPVARFNFPNDVAFHQGKVYVADRENHRIRVLTPPP